MQTMFKLTTNTFEELIDALKNHIGTAQIDNCKANSIMTVEPTKYLETGRLHKHYRITQNFIVVENVLHGFAKKFLDGIEIYTIDGCKIAKLFHIRNNSYTTESSRESVLKFLKEFLHTKENVDKHLQLALDELYDAAFQNRFYLELTKK